jgi:hypothetical protein
MKFSHSVGFCRLTERYAFLYVAIVADWKHKRVGGAKGDDTDCESAEGAATVVDILRKLILPTRPHVRRMGLSLYRLGEARLCPPRLSAALDRDNVGSEMR